MMDKIAELEKRLNTAVSPHDRIAALNDLALALVTIDLNRAYDLAQEAIVLEQTNQSDIHVATLYVLGYVYWNRGEFGDALQNLTMARRQVEATGDTILHLQILTQLAVTYLDVGEHVEAVTHYQQLLKMARESNDQYFEAVALNGIGLSHSDDKPDVALTYFQQAYTLFTELGREHDAAVAVNNTAMMLLMLGKLDEALQFAHQALNRFVNMNSSRGKLLTLGSLTEIYCERQDFANARLYFLQAQAIADAEKRQNYQALQAVLYTRIQIGQGIPDDALPELQKALDIAKRIGAKKTQYRLHESFALVYEQLEDYENAYKHYKEYHHVYTDVFNEARQRKIENLRITFQTEAALKEAETQRQLREQETQHFEQLSQMQEELLNIASHDLKNPLATIQTLIFLVRHPAIEEAERQRHLDTIDSQIAYMQELIVKLLDLARLQTGASFEPRLIEIQAFIKGLVDNFQERCLEKQIELTMTADFDNLQVIFDPLRLNQAMLNLLSNALKFTSPSGKITVNLEHDNDFVTIRIRDTGIGIPLEALPHLFERFYRVENADYESQEGTGLGLSIVKSIVEQHGGEISVESIPNEGSTFSFTLPYERFINGNQI